MLLLKLNFICFCFEAAIREKRKRECAEFNYLSECGLWKEPSVQEASKPSLDSGVSASISSGYRFIISASWAGCGGGGGGVVSDSQRRRFRKIPRKFSNILGWNHQFSRRLRLILLLFLWQPMSRRIPGWLFWTWINYLPPETWGSGFNAPLARCKNIVDFSSWAVWVRWREMLVFPDNS